MDKISLADIIGTEIFNELKAAIPDAHVTVSSQSFFSR